MLKASPLLGEGHRKVKARLAAKGIRVGKNRLAHQGASTYERYNNGWLLQRHGYMTPAQVREGTRSVGHHPTLWLWRRAVFLYLAWSPWTGWETVMRWRTSCRTQW